MPNEAQIKQAYLHCQTIANQHYENFPTASLLIRADLRGAVAVIYAFARAADDFADEGEIDADERLRLLDEWEHELDLCLSETSEHLIFIALADVLKKHAIPVQLLRDLLIAFRMDVQFTGFENLAALQWYAKHSANPVGRLVLLLYGIVDEQAHQRSDAICTALQLTNFWQDFVIDIPKGRCYLPDAWLQLAGVSRQQVLAGAVDAKQLDPAIRQAIFETQYLFHQGYALLPCLPWRLRIQIAATLAGGERILQTTAELHDPLQQRPVLSKRSWLAVSVRIITMTLFPTLIAQQLKDKS